MTTAAFNLTTVAARLDVKPRFLFDWLRKHPWDKFGQPYYSAIAGKKKLFTEADIARIFAALPKPKAQPCPSSFARPIAATRRTGSGARTSGSVLTEALALARKKSQRNSFPSGKQRSNVVPMRGRKTRLSPPPL
jgi:hypothetical protein